MNRIAFACGAAVLSAAFAFPQPASASCGASFCAVNTSWDVQGVWAEPGLRADLRYEYVDQDRVRTGSDRIGVGQIRKHHDEVYTVSRNLLATLDYAHDARWGVRLTIPVVDRDHVHIHNHHGARLNEAWNFTRLGDVRVVGRYQFTPSQAGGAARNARSSVTGVTFGLKLPTGDFDVRNAGGDLAERTLQPGSGTVDLLVGAYFRQSLPVRGMSWYVQGQYEVPLRERDGFRPGNRVGADVGVRYDVGDRLGLMLQLNSIFRGKDRGPQAEREDSGGRAFFLSPGAAYAVTDAVQAYVFYQHPLYQHVDGVQLTVGRAVVAGLSARF